MGGRFVTAKKNYNRYFIIFQEEDKGYGIAIDKQPTGYTKIETKGGKCKITVYVQNLIKEKGPYVCCLVDSTKDPVLVAKLGQISIDSTGRGETWWEYSEDNIAGTGTSYDRFNVAAVLPESKDGAAPLAGYVGKDRATWKDRMPVKTRGAEPNKSNKENVEKKENVVKKENPVKEENEVEEVKEVKKKVCEEEPAKKSNKAEENLPEDDEIDAMRADSNKENVENVENVENTEEPEEEPVEYDEQAKKFKEYENEIKKQVDDMKDSQSNIYNMSEAENVENVENVEKFSYEEPQMEKSKGKSRTYAGVFQNMLKSYEEVEIITDEDLGCTWWKVPYADNNAVRDNSLYPYYCTINHLKMTYPYINYIKYFKKCGYYYFGIKHDSDGEIKYIVYGIEGKKIQKEHPYMGMTGFAKWVKMKYKDTGMWLMYYNPYSGCIMIPKDVKKSQCED